MISKYMQVVWLYLIGIAIIFFGLMMLTAKSGPSSFVVMLMGLAIAAIGAAHGRRMRALGQLDLEKIMEKEDGREAPQKAQKKETEKEEAQMEEEPEEKKQEKPAGPTIGARFNKAMSALKKGPLGFEINEEAIEGIEMEDMKRGKIAATTADVVQLVCPKCMAENDDKNYYCFKCGNKLRKTQSRDRDEAMEVEIEPGTISVIDDKKVAKIMICPKCNLANKIGDKYCWNCGKKMRSDSAVAATRAPRGGRGIPEVDALFSEPRKKRGRKGRKKAKSNLKNADEVKS